MIISHRKKFAFFANQKIGSKAVGLMLRLSGVFDENDIMMAQPFPATRSVDIELPAYNIGDYSSLKVAHMTPTDAIEAGFITLEQLREYDCYAFLRDPKERFMASRAAMQMNRDGFAVTPKRPKMGGCPPPQFTFFFVGDEQVVTPLDFANFGSEVRTLLDTLGGYNHMDVAQIMATYNIRMLPITQVHYEPKDHMKDIALYRELTK